MNRTEAINRVGYLMPALSDEGLRQLLIAAEHLAKVQPRDLTSEALAVEQAAREAVEVSCSGPETQPAPERRDTVRCREVADPDDRGPRMAWGTWTPGEP